MEKMIKVGIFGATGYAGIELVEILERHGQVEVVFVTSESSAGSLLSEIHPPAPVGPLIAGEAAPLDQVEVVFLCLPHAASAATAVRAREFGCRVIDLSADFRLKKAAVYEHWYRVTHPRPDWLAEAVYGLTEHAREALREADIVACPGCYPTSILLPLLPLVRAGAVAPGGTIIADSKSGVSGGGRKPLLQYHFVEVADNMTPYGIGQSHRHWVEMDEQLRRAANGTAPNLIFSPHLMPIPRGLLSTIYLPLAAGWDGAAARDLLEAAYGEEPFIALLPEGKQATVAHVLRSNRCAIALTPTGAGTLIITSAIDNITKGSSGQAVQNFNVMFGLDERMGLVQGLGDRR